MIIAIYGSSCVGKSVVANALAERLCVRVRHCGELIKDRAAAKGTSTGALSPEDHRDIDAHTRSLAQEEVSTFVIEGTYLNHVLAELDHIFLVHLTCESSERQLRLQKRSGTNAADIALRDSADRSLSDALYDKTIPRKPDFTLDTTSLQVGRVAEMIETCIREREKNG